MRRPITTSIRPCIAPRCSPPHLRRLQPTSPFQRRLQPSTCQRTSSMLKHPTRSSPAPPMSSSSKETFPRDTPRPPTPTNAVVPTGDAYFGEGMSDAGGNLNFAVPAGHSWRLHELQAPTGYQPDPAFHCTTNLTTATPAQAMSFALPNSPQSRQCWRSPEARAFGWPAEEARQSCLAHSFSWRAIPDASGNAPRVFWPT